MTPMKSREEAEKQAEEIVMRDYSANHNPNCGIPCGCDYQAIIDAIASSLHANRLQALRDAREAVEKQKWPYTRDWPDDEALPRNNIVDSILAAFDQLIKDEEGV